MIINLIRTESGEEGTFSRLLVGRHEFACAELPWENNQRFISCIPFGEYTCSLVHSPKYGKAYQVHGVLNRTHILFHVGNWAGAEDKGFISNSDGCILIGQSIVSINGQKAVSNSRESIEKFHNCVDAISFTLLVSGFDIW